MTNEAIGVYLKKAIYINGLLYMGIGDVIDFLWCYEI
jgi:hypothetical protein